ncbi:hypothetical protein [Nocardia lijiangensis]|uniref:ATP-dependent DNA ligase n=1 Tax=Nocardia lijiangensis TaxID=299618 RepID=UPI003D74D5C2
MYCAQRPQRQLSHTSSENGRPSADASHWAIEMKWDGMRAICRTQDGHVDFYSRNRNNVTSLGVPGA